MADTPQTTLPTWAIKRAADALKSGVYGIARALSDERERRSLAIKIVEDETENDELRRLRADNHILASELAYVMRGWHPDDVFRSNAEILATVDRALSDRPQDDRE